MSAVIEGIIKELERALERQRAPERQRDLLKQLKLALDHDFESELQARLADLRTQLEQTAQEGRT
jgi:hypothetical protein